MAEIVEYLLATDNYNRPRKLQDKDALAVLLVRLLLMDPGTNPLHPEMGVGIIKRYRFAGAEDMSALNREIEKQIVQFLPTYRQASANCTLIEKNMLIEIKIDDTLFSFTTENDESKILPGQIVLSDRGY